MGQRPGRGSLGRHSTPISTPDSSTPAGAAVGQHEHSSERVETRREKLMEAAPVNSGMTAGATTLTEREQEILAFERQWWKYAGAKEQAVRELFDMSATRYYQVLNALIDRPEALTFDPMLTKRLRRLRAARQRARSARRLGASV